MTEKCFLLGVNNITNTTTNAAGAMQPAISKALVIRTAMIGGGTSYAVYWRTKDKPSHPLHGYTYATTISTETPEGKRADFFDTRDAIDSKDRWGMEQGWDKYEAGKRLEKRAARLAFRVAVRAFPELRALRKLPTLWAAWNMPSESKWIPVRVALPA